MMTLLAFFVTVVQSNSIYNTSKCCSSPGLDENYINMGVSIASQAFTVLLSLIISR